MTTNPWVNRISALLLLVVIYAAGYAGGRDQAMLAQPRQLHLQSKMSDSDIYWTFVTAQKYGGSFYKLLGNAGLAADPTISASFLDTWPMMIATYGTASRLASQPAQRGTQYDLPTRSTTPTQPSAPATCTPLPAARTTTGAAT